jgi:hypothetical protein
MSRPKPRPTIDQHRALSATITDLRQRLRREVDATMNRRVPAAALDAALAVDRWLNVLTLRLQDDLDQPQVYAHDVPATDAVPVPARRGRLTADEHRALGAALYAVRDGSLDLFTALSGHYPKASRVQYAARRVTRILDRLRSRLDGLFAGQHPREFTTRAYYPGGGAPPSPVAVATVSPDGGGGCR